MHNSSMKLITNVLHLKDMTYQNSNSKLWEYNEENTNNNVTYINCWLH